MTMWSIGVLELTLSLEGTFGCMQAASYFGVNFFDSAEGYAGGESEIVMGEAIKKFGWKRNDIVISTKVSHTFLGSPSSSRR